MTGVCVCVCVCVSLELSDLLPSSSWVGVSEGCIALVMRKVSVPVNEKRKGTYVEKTKIKKKTKKKKSKGTDCKGKEAEFTGHPISSHIAESFCSWPQFVLKSLWVPGDPLNCGDFYFILFY